MSERDEGAVGLSDDERTVLLEPCKCGHDIDDHGDTIGCWGSEGDACDKGCRRSHTDLLGERLAGIRDAAVARALEEASSRIAQESTWEIWSDTGKGAWTISTYAARRAIAQVRRAALTAAEAAGTRVAGDVGGGVE